MSNTEPIISEYLNYKREELSDGRNMKKITHVLMLLSFKML